ncbi:MAG: efflux RND transporter periplasmic adaptor subunit [Pirellulales bacterium]
MTASSELSRNASSSQHVGFKNKIVAQGQLLPADGIARIAAVPGDVVEKVLIKAGSAVAAGELLLEMRSAQTRAAQINALRIQQQEAELQQQAAVIKAELELKAARLQLQQAHEQAASMERRREALDIGKKQVTDAEAGLARAESIAADPLTKNMISQLDLDKQRSEVDGAKLQYSQQLETWTSARDAARFAEQAAEEKVSAAEKTLGLTKSAQPSAVLAAQIEAAEQQLSASRITSPIDGTIVAVDAHVGDTVGQLPLVQLADLSKMICRVEVYQTDAVRLNVGRGAVIRNAALSKSLRGRVVQVDRLIGNPHLRSSDPLAKVDYRTIVAVIEIDREDTAAAAQWLQLQVEVEIEADGTAPAAAGS